MTNRRAFLRSSVVILACAVVPAEAAPTRRRLIDPYQQPNDGNVYDLVAAPGYRSFRRRMSPYLSSNSAVYPKDASGVEDFSAKPVDSIETRVMLIAASLVLRNGDLARYLFIEFKSIRKYGETSVDSVVLTLPQVPDVQQRFRDLVRIGRTWSHEGVPTDSRTIRFNPVNDFNIGIDRVAGLADVFRVHMGYKSHQMDLLLPEFSQLADQFDTYTDWLRKES